MTPAVAAERREIEGPTGRVSYYTAGPEESQLRPLLLVHSVNAAASAFEMQPLFEHYRQQRHVYALDLPGFGFSQRGDRDYTPRLMTDAVVSLAAEIRRVHGGQRLDAMAVSLGSEFLARAAAERADDYASVALVSPTAFNGTAPRRGPPGSNRGMPGLYRFFTFPLWSKAFYTLLTSRASIGFFMRKTFGSRHVPPALIDYAWCTSHQPGARHAPYRFVSGYLFSGDIFGVYESLPMPVWMVHGVRGDFQDYRLTRLVKDRDNWLVQVFETGALPQFELLEAFLQGYDAFLERAAARG